MSRSIAVLVQMSVALCFFFKAIFSVRRQETFHSLVKLSYNAEFDHFALSFNRERLRNLLLS